MGSNLNEDQFQSLIEHSLDAIGLIQGDGTVSYISPAIFDILGYTPDEFQHLDAFEIVHPDERLTAEQRFQDLLRTDDGCQTVVNRARHKDGSWRWLEVISTNKLSDANIGAIIANFRDITEQKRAASRIQEAEEKFRSIVESATEFAIFTTDLDGRVNSWNSGATRLLGYEEAEVLGKDARIVFTPEDNARDQAESEMQDAIERGHGDDERWHIKKDGTRFWGSGLMMPLRDDTNRICGYLKIFRDTTRAKQAQDALEEANHKKDKFLAILAHELRNPLAAISNAAHLLNPVDPTTFEWGRGVIQRQSNYLARLLDDLLDISRFTQGKIRLKQERIDLAVILARSIEAVRPLMDEKRQILSFLCAPDDLFVFVDPVRMEQALVNLLTNAMKYTDAEGRISVTAERSSQVVIAVEDTGIGISQELLPRIFDLFIQADHSLDRSKGGLGIGLTLARSIVELHGGTISAKSSGLGQGSQFVITLPLGPEQPKQVPEPLPPSQQLQKGMRILVVDDNRDSAIGLQKLLTIWGHEVELAHDGPEALERVRTYAPQVILLDIGLPGLDGYEVARRIRTDASLPQPLTLIAISGYGLEEDRRRSRAAGFDDHLVKPVNFDTLKNLLNSRSSRTNR